MTSPKVPRAYSVSQLRRFEECPLSWRFQYIDKMKEEPSRILAAGAAAHAAIAEYLTRCHAARLPSDAAIIPDCIEAARVDGDPIGVSYRADVAAVLDKFAGSFAVQFRAPEIEQRHGFRSDWSPCEFFAKDVRWRGVIDLLDVPAPEFCHITDWKTGYKIDGDVEDSLQLRAYGFMATILHPSTAVVKVSLWHARYGFEQSCQYAAEDLAGVRDELEGRMAEIDAETKFTATPGDHCQRCGFRRLCPVYKASGRTNEIPEDPVALAAAYALAKARVKELEAAVKVRVEADGPIDLGKGRVLGYVGSERWSNTDAKGLTSALLARGVPAGDVWRAIGLSKTDVMKLLRAAGMRDDIDVVLDEYGERQVTTSLREHKADAVGGEE